jgi:hypothetical protein
LRLQTGKIPTVSHPDLLGLVQVKARNPQKYLADLPLGKNHPFFLIDKNIPIIYKNHLEMVFPKNKPAFIDLPSNPSKKSMRIFNISISFPSKNKSHIPSGSLT